MTRRTRYFVLAALAVLLIGLAGGLVAYLAYARGDAVAHGVPAEMRYVPVDAAIVAFADVNAVMNSDVRRSLTGAVDPESRKGRQMMNDFAGVDVEKQVDHIIAYVEGYSPAESQPQGRPQLPRTLVLVQGTFDPARVEAFIRGHEGRIDEYKGRKMFLHTEEGHDAAVGLVGSDLIALGQPDLVRRAIDMSQDRAGLAKNITTNVAMMNLIRENAGSTAWVVGQFDEITRRMRLPNGFAEQVPPIRMVSVHANINGGIKAAIRADAADKAAADQLRDVVRGFMALARLQAVERQELANTLKSVELSGTDTTVRLSFAVSPETLRLVAPRGRRRGGAESVQPAPPPTPPPPALPPPPQP